MLLKEIKKVFILEAFFIYHFLEGIMILKKTLLALSCTVLLTACGGGGSSSSDGTSNNGGSGETTNPSDPLRAHLAKAKQLDWYHKQYYCVF